MKIIRDGAKSIYGCDSVVIFSDKKRDSKLKLLQITDTQVIDSQQLRTPDRLGKAEIAAWGPDKIYANFGNHLKSLIAQANPDIIFITGDMVYGSFDDSGKIFTWFCEFMDSFGIPWAPVFGNHDNESLRGVDWQCDMLEHSKYCLFHRGNVSGNGNYTVGLCVEDEMVLVMHMMDSHGCFLVPSLYPDQLELIQANTQLITEKQGKKVPGLIGFHFPTKDFQDAEIAKGYATAEGEDYVIGVDVPAKDGDFGSKLQNHEKVTTMHITGFRDLLKECNIQAVFVGHFHSINTCITYENIKWVYGLKTSQYDYLNPGHIGGTLAVWEDEAFHISHLPSLVTYSPFPGTSPIFKNFFVKE